MKSLEPFVCLSLTLDQLRTLSFQWLLDENEAIETYSNKWENVEQFGYWFAATKLKNKSMNMFMYKSKSGPITRVLNLCSKLSGVFAEQCRSVIATKVRISITIT